MNKPRVLLGSSGEQAKLLRVIARRLSEVADLVPWSNNQYLHDLLPNSDIHPLDAGHFAWEQAADEYGRLVVEWVSGGYRRVAAP
jgi:pimeloyl-ACP methyl ester carboxylesterase